MTRQSYVFNDSAHGARLFGLKEFGNIYSRIMNVSEASHARKRLEAETVTSRLSMSSKSAWRPSRAVSRQSPPRPAKLLSS